MAKRKSISLVKIVLLRTSRASKMNSRAIQDLRGLIVNYSEAVRVFPTVQAFESVMNGLNALLNATVGEPSQQSVHNPVLPIQEEDDEYRLVFLARLIGRNVEFQALARGFPNNGLYGQIINILTENRVVGEDTVINELHEQLRATNASPISSISSRDFNPSPIVSSDETENSPRRDSPSSESPTGSSEVSR